MPDVASIEQHLQEQINDLQSRLVHQDDIIEGLNDVVAYQSHELECLKTRFLHQSEQLQALLDATSGTIDKPPHF